MIETAKSLVHQLTQQMQVVLGHLEMGDLPSALKATMESNKTLRRLARLLASLHEGAA